MCSLQISKPYLGGRSITTPHCWMRLLCLCRASTAYQLLLSVLSQEEVTLRSVTPRPVSAVASAGGWPAPVFGWDGGLLPDRGLVLDCRAPIGHCSRTAVPGLSVAPGLPCPDWGSLQNCRAYSEHGRLGRCTTTYLGEEPVGVCRHGCNGARCRQRLCSGFGARNCCCCTGCTALDGVVEHLRRAHSGGTAAALACVHAGLLAGTLNPGAT